MKLTTWGACGTVTGSCHLLEHQGFKLLLDCGMYQGEPKSDNYDPFGFDPREVDAVVLSHAHLDHVGRIPRLYRLGFEGRVYATAPTLKLIRPILEDALKLMKEDIKRARRKGLPVPELLWEEADVRALLERSKPLPYYGARKIGPFRVTLRNAGHLPGSAFVEVQAGGRTLVFSGDLGNRRKETLPDPDYPRVADLVLSESTYGDRPHRPFQATLVEFAEVLAQTLDGGGKVVIPSFALERAQEILFYIRRFEAEGAIPSVPVYVDSPLTTRISEIYGEIQEAFSPLVQSFYRRGIDPFAPQKLRYTQSVDESKRLNFLEGPAIIIAGSGMLSGGRILHHLRHQLPDARNALVFVGYQPRGGLGHRIIEGAGEVRIHGHEVPVRAKVYSLGGFSGHAGRDELLDWLTAEPRIVLVHGEDPARASLARALRARGAKVTRARLGQRFEV
ncbi:MBL fold metallo-hydrolase [Oceanithermus sp.]|uniref:MBL fold metallo-hydrolase n=1 Tax=Oceanithermus sp. TaxID=2268145 RepID=UPI002579E8DD|nr:MBL fold metallo-hydrolase [Oceanithermus sp.]